MPRGDRESDWVSLGERTGLADPGSCGRHHGRRLRMRAGPMLPAAAERGPRPGGPRARGGRARSSGVGFNLVWRGAPWSAAISRVAAGRPRRERGVGGREAGSESEGGLESEGALGLENSFINGKRGRGSRLRRVCCGREIRGWIRGEAEREGEQRGREERSRSSAISFARGAAALTLCRGACRAAGERKREGGRG